MKIHIIFIVTIYHLCDYSTIHINVEYNIYLLGTQINYNHFVVETERVKIILTLL